MKKYILPILLGTLISSFVLWAFESFKPLSSGFFIGAIGRSLAIMIVVVLLVANMKKVKQ
jgi:branched-subunit amino acid transport protein AzlD